MQKVFARWSFVFLLVSSSLFLSSINAQDQDQEDENSESSWSIRTKRSLFNFYRVIKCSTGKNPFSSYNNYGCWCGRGGRGQVVDGIDQCCFDHDECYRSLREANVCNKWTRYVDGYDWECVKSVDLIKSVDKAYLEMVRNATVAPSSMIRGNFSLDYLEDATFGNFDDKNFGNNSANDTQVLARMIGGDLISANSTRKYPVCRNSRTDCGRGLCACDVRAAVCFGANMFPAEKPKCSSKK